MGRDVEFEREEGGGKGVIYKQIFNVSPAIRISNCFSVFIVDVPSIWPLRYTKGIRK